MHGVVRGIQLELHGDAGQRYGMAQRNQFPGAFSALDGGNARHAEHIALFGVALLHHREGRRLHNYAAHGPRHTMGFGFFADVNHVGLAPFIEMREWIVHVMLRN